jgi:hypothetical protein
MAKRTQINRSALAGRNVVRPTGGVGGRVGQTRVPLPTLQQASDRGRLNWDQFNWTHRTQSGNAAQDMIKSGIIYGDGDYGSGGYLAAGKEGWSEYGDRKIDVKINPQNPRFGGDPFPGTEDVHFPTVEPTAPYNRKNKKALGGMAIVRDPKVSGNNPITSMRETTFDSSIDTYDILSRMGTDDMPWADNKDITNDVWKRFAMNEGYEPDAFVDYVNTRKMYNQPLDLDNNESDDDYGDSGW